MNFCIENNLQNKQTNYIDYIWDEPFEKVMEEKDIWNSKALLLSSLISTNLKMNKHHHQKCPFAIFSGKIRSPDVNSWNNF